MSDRKPSFEELNAYVDKELSIERAAYVARWIARDASLARTVAALARLRSTLPDTVAPPTAQLVAPAPPGMKRTPWVLAASIAVCLLVTGALALTLGHAPPASAWVEAALASHNAWQLPGKGANRSVNALIQQAAIRDHGLANAYIPDLSASKLSVVFVDRRPVQIEGPAIIVGYAGTRGCKVTLAVMAEGSAAPDDITFLTEDANLAYAWRAGDLAYLLAAVGMDRGRFDLIAESVHRATIERLPFDDDTRVALLDSRRKSLPCLT